MIRLLGGLGIVFSGWWLVLWAAGIQVWSGVFWLVVLGSFIIGIGTRVASDDD